ncbi:MAG: hypothetical protein ACTSYD_05255 [Candidatus Heimdallarchaeaceae archaeon]
MSWHAFFKKLLLNVLKNKKLEIFIEKEVGSLPLKIDMVIKKSDNNVVEETEYLKSFLTMLSKWNVIEFKMIKESVTLPKLLKMIGYFGLFAAQNSFSFRDTRDTKIWILTTRKPVKLFKSLEQNGYKILSCGFSGCYETFFYVPFRFVVFNELPLEKEFYPFLLFSQGKKLEKFISHVLSQNNKVFINWSYFLYKEKLIQMAKAQHKALDSITRSVRSAVMELGIKNVIEAVGLEEVIKAVGLEEVIKVVGLEKILDTIPLKDIEAFIKKKKQNN